MAVWNYIILSSTFLLICFLIWQELMRINRSRLVWRMAASVVAAISLACLCFPFTFRVAKSFDASKEAVLLTAGFNEDSLRNFLTKAYKQLPVYTTEAKVLEAASSFKPQLIPDVNTPDHDTNELNNLHVFGYGLKNDELQKLHHLPLLFHPSQISAGITAINWQSKLTAGEKLLVQGTFNNSFPKQVKMVLSGLNTNLDSAMIPAKTAGTFELTTTPKHIDRAVYHLFALLVNDTVEAEDIPVQITQPKSIQILMLAASPDFENKFLKNELSKNGYLIAVRSRISKDKFEKEYANIAALSINTISADVLDKFDVVIADAAELHLISRSELGAIQSAVQNKGLGLVVKADSSLKPSSFYAGNFSVVAAKDTNAKNLTLFLLGNNEKPFKLPAGQPVSIHVNPGTQPLVYNERSDVFVNSTIYGKGRIIISTLENTYTLLLSGRHDDYAALWSLLIEKAVKKLAVKDAVAVSPALPVVYEPAFLSIKNEGVMQPGQVGEDKVYLQQDKQLPGTYTGTYWPIETGWLPNVDVQGKIHWLYIFKTNAWRTIDAANRLNATRQYASKHVAEKVKHTELKKDVPVTVPKIYFFIAFTICAGFLWLEKKI